jgi:tRNA (adenine37-N6)-methyltransferase
LLYGDVIVRILSLPEQIQLFLKECRRIMITKKEYKCSECDRPADRTRIFEIDGARICASCLYGEATPFEIWPIGVIKNKLQRDEAGFGTRGPENISRIELLPSQKRFLYKLDEEKYITIVYYLHARKAVTSIFKRGLDGKKTGVFATRTPDRLSGIGIQDVKLVGIKETTLYVEGLDAIDGTPVIDIKMCWSSVECP